MAVGNVLLVTRWLILSSAYKSRESMMVYHRAVDQLKSWDSSINMSPPDPHNWLSGLICRTLSQPPSYKETSSFWITHKAENLNLNSITKVHHCPISSVSHYQYIQIMNRLAVIRSARAQQAHKVNNNTNQLISVGTCPFKAIDTHLWPSTPAYHDIGP